MIQLTLEWPKRAGFTGVLGASKDFNAKRAGYEVIGFADPLYTVAEIVKGTSDKRVPGIRSFLQQVGQWGRGTVNESYPDTAEREHFRFAISRGWLFERMKERWPQVQWDSFGYNENIWCDALVERLLTANKPTATTNVRFPNEASALRQHGIALFHVTCSRETLAVRRKAAGYSDEGVNDISEQMALRYDELLRTSAWPDANHRVLWNDAADIPPPDGPGVIIHPV